MIEIQERSPLTTTLLGHMRGSAAWLNYRRKLRTQLTNKLPGRIFAKLIELPLPFSDSLVADSEESGFTHWVRPNDLVALCEYSRLPIVVVGQAGSARMLVMAQIAWHWVRHNNNVPALLIDLSNDDQAELTPQALVSNMLHEAGETLVAEHGPIETRRPWHLLINGIEQLPETRRADWHSFLQSLPRLWPDAQLVLALPDEETRLSYWPHSVPLAARTPDDQQLDRLLQCLVAPNKRDIVRASLGSNSNLSKLRERTLEIILLAWMVQEQGLPANRTALWAWSLAQNQLDPKKLGGTWLREHPISQAYSVARHFIDGNYAWETLHSLPADQQREISLFLAELVDDPSALFAALWQEERFAESSYLQFLGAILQTWLQAHPSPRIEPESEEWLLRMLELLSQHYERPELELNLTQLSSCIERLIAQPPMLAGQESLVRIASRIPRIANTLLSQIVDQIHFQPQIRWQAADHIIQRAPDHHLLSQLSQHTGQDGLSQAARAYICAFAGQEGITILGQPQGVQWLNLFRSDAHVGGARQAALKRQLEWRSDLPVQLRAASSLLHDDSEEAPVEHVAAAEWHEQGVTPSLRSYITDKLPDLEEVAPQIASRLVFGETRAIDNSFDLDSADDQSAVTQPISAYPELRKRPTQPLSELDSDLPAPVILPSNEQLSSAKRSSLGESAPTLSEQKSAEPESLLGIVNSKHPLLQVLNNHLDSETRRAGLDELRLLPDGALLLARCALMEHLPPWLQQEAVIAIDGCPDCGVLLRKLMRAPKAHDLVRAQAVQLLSSHLKNSPAPKELIECARDASYPITRRAAVETLGTVGPHIAAIEVLTALVSEDGDDHELIGAAIQALGHQAGAQALRPISAWLGMQAVARLQQHWAKSIKQLAAPLEQTWPRAQLSKGQRLQLATTFARSANPADQPTTLDEFLLYAAERLSRIAAEVLVRIGDSRASKAIIEALEQAPALFIPHLVQALIELEGDNSSLLIALQNEHLSQQARWQLLEAAPSSLFARYHEQLLAMTHSDAFTRGAVALGMGRCEARDVLSVLRQLIGSSQEHSYVREQALRAAGRLGGAESEALLLSVATDTSVATPLRRAAIEALPYPLSSEGCQQLQFLIQSERANHGLLASSLTILGGNRDSSAIRAFMSLSQHEDSEVAIAALGALEELEDSNVISLLVHITQSPQIAAAIRVRAAGVAFKLCGEPYLLLLQTFLDNGALPLQLQAFEELLHSQPKHPLIESIVFDRSRPLALRQRATWAMVGLQPGSDLSDPEAGQLSSSQQNMLTILLADQHEELPLRLLFAELLRNSAARSEGAPKLADVCNNLLAEPNLAPSLQIRALAILAALGPHVLESLSHLAQNSLHDEIFHHWCLTSMLEATTHANQNEVVA
jgi:hypothetical protein